MKTLTPLAISAALLLCLSCVLALALTVAPAGVGITSPSLSQSQLPLIERDICKVRFSRLKLGSVRCIV